MRHNYEGFAAHTVQRVLVFTMLIMLAGAVFTMPGCKKSLDKATLEQLRAVSASSLERATAFQQALPTIKAKETAEAPALDRYVKSHLESLAKAARAWDNLNKAATQSGALSTNALAEAKADVETSLVEAETWKQASTKLTVTPEFAASHYDALKLHSDRVTALAERLKKLEAKSITPPESSKTTD